MQGKSSVENGGSDKFNHHFSHGKYNVHGKNAAIKITFNGWYNFRWPVRFACNGIRRKNVSIGEKQMPAIPTN